MIIVGATARVDRSGGGMDVVADLELTREYVGRQACFFEKPAAALRALHTALGTISERASSS